MILRVLVVILMLNAPAALAAQTPTPGAADPRVSYVDYDPWQVVKLSGALRTALQVQFAPDETIANVAVGDSSGWEVAADGASLFLKPKAPGDPTNLIVTTRKGAEMRHYAFALTAAPQARPSSPFVIVFRYPEDERAHLAASLAAQVRRSQARLIDLELENAVLEGTRNLTYQAQGASSLQPSEVSDNGRFTVLRFAANQALPAIYQVDARGTESLASFDVRGEFVVLHAVAPQWRLRRGREVLCLYNEAFEPYGVATGTGTATSRVERVEKAPVR
ncbi:TrbG/VirB9 family P-type conjugative transfer protein [Phenylobacterium sp.]|uniref:TrbG/VirB9 family P-type conjugative transfer protein n=1 Tax=Phenylobacterium sp. TaxID=1871053 RepID=UPI0030F3B490